MPRVQTLAQMALAVRQRVDLGGQNNAFGNNSDDNITDQEMTSYLNASLCEVFGILVSKFGDNYYWAPDYLLPVQNGVFVYPLPQDMYKLVNVDQLLQGAQGGGYTPRSIKPYNNHQRNQNPGYVGASQSYLGWQNLSYQMQGGNITFLPNTGNLINPIRLQYIPEPPLLVATLPTPYLVGTNYDQGDYVYVSLTTPNGIATNQVMVALNAGTSGAAAPGVLKIGTGTAAVTYTAIGPTTPWMISQMSGGTPSVTVSGLTITVTTGTDTANQVAALFNATSAVSPFVTAVGGGTGTAVTGSGSLNPWYVPGTTQDNTILWAYQCPLTLCQTYFDGIAGWEDFVILDTAIKCATKQESSQLQDFMVQRQMMLQRVEEEATNRQAGDPMVVTGGYGSEEGDNFGDGSEGFGWGSW